MIKDTGTEIQSAAAGYHTRTHTTYTHTHTPTQQHISGPPAAELKGRGQFASPTTKKIDFYWSIILYSVIKCISNIKRISNSKRQILNTYSNLSAAITLVLK
jgi:hypothetical protein